MSVTPLAFKPVGPYNKCIIGGQSFELTSDGGELPVAVGPIVDGRNTGKEKYKLLLACSDGNIAQYYTFEMPR